MLNNKDHRDMETSCTVLSQVMKYYAWFYGVSMKEMRTMKYKDMAMFLDYSGGIKL